MTKPECADREGETLLDTIDDPCGVLECASAVLEWCDAEKLEPHPGLILGLTQLILHGRQRSPSDKLLFDVIPLGPLG